jgi:hypothetical protein
MAMLVRPSVRVAQGQTSVRQGENSMRKLLGTVVLVAIVIAIVGGTRNWFTVQKSDKGESTEVHLLINREKIRSDTQNAREVARELRENLGTKLERKFDARTE